MTIPFAHNHVQILVDWMHDKPLRLEIEAELARRIENPGHPIPSDSQMAGVLITALNEAYSGIPPHVTGLLLGVCADLIRRGQMREVQS